MCRPCNSHMLSFASKDCSPWTTSEMEEHLYWNELDMQGLYVKSEQAPNRQTLGTEGDFSNESTGVVDVDRIDNHITKKN